MLLNHIKKYILLVLVGVTFTINGQQKQPKVGLILSGGGAKGFAHIGVLKAIDEAGLQIDYIGGTSMGAVIGGLYAAGYSGKQLEEIVQKTDFVSLLGDITPRNSIPFFEKTYGENHSLSLTFNKGEIGFPKGVSKGQRILNYLTELLDNTEGITDFSKLPIPFFCIATDVETGKEIVFEQGSLPLAIRASASFPTLLTPVEIDNKLLIDGGVANNFPVDIMKSKEVDILIGVDVEGKLYKKDKLASVVTILNQIINYQMYEKSDIKKQLLDIYIHPKVYSYNVFDFKNKDSLISKGASIGQQYAPVFKEIAARQHKKAIRKKMVLDHKKRKVEAIAISGIKDYTRAYVLGKLNIKEGDSLSRKELSSKINQLLMTKNYDRIEYNFEEINADTHRLNLQLIESKEDTKIKLGVHYDFLYKSSLLVNLTKKNLFLKNDLFSMDAILGDHIRYHLNYFIDNGFYFSYGFRSKYQHFEANSAFNPIVSSFPSLSKVSLQYSELANEVFVQTTFNRKFAIALGLAHKNLFISSPTIRVNEKKYVFDNTHYFSTFGYMKLDTYDDANFPTSGLFVDLNFNWYLSAKGTNSSFSPFTQTKGTIGFATSISRGLTLQITNEAGFTLSQATNEVFDFSLGNYNKNYANNFISFYGYEFAALSDKSFVKTEATFRQKLKQQQYLSLTANYARVADNVFKDIGIFDNIKSGYAVGYSLNTLLGPIEIKYTWSPDNNQQYWLFNLGYWF